MMSIYNEWTLHLSLSTHIQFTIMWFYRRHTFVFTWWGYIVSNQVTKFIARHQMSSSRVEIEMYSLICFSWPRKFVQYIGRIPNIPTENTVGMSWGWKQVISILWKLDLRHSTRETDQFQTEFVIGLIINRNRLAIRTCSIKTIQTEIQAWNNSLLPLFTFTRGYSRSFVGICTRSMYIKDFNLIFISTINPNDLFLKKFYQFN